jgi:arylsulfatase
VAVEPVAHEQGHGKRVAPAMPTARNILLVMADQHRADVMGCAGDPTVHTPNLDRLAAEGVRFSRTSCQGPLCMPARASFLTERYVRDHGVYTNWAEVAQGSPTYLHALRDAGYHTVMLGKAHLTRDDTGAISSGGRRHTDALAYRLEERGFAEVHETGDKFSIDPPNRYIDHLRERGLLDAYATHIADRSYQGERESGRGATKRVPMWDSTPSPLPPADYIDTWTGQLAARWLQKYDGDEPFFAFVGFPGPHDPWDAPREAVDAYAGHDVEMPRSTRRPDTAATGRYGRLLDAFLNLSDTDTMTDAAIQGMRRAYAANVSIIDNAVGSLLAVLETRGMLDDTWVLYTSDHGEMGGNHGMMSKCVLYEQSVRVPLLVRPPGGHRPGVVTDLVEHVDVPATVRAIASAAAVPASEGRSLLGYLDGGDPEPRPLAVSENWGFASFETDRYKLVVDEDAGTPCQLFDLRDDPDEDENRVADPECAAVVDELMAETVRPFLATPPARPHASPFTG